MVGRATANLLLHKMGPKHLQGIFFAFKGSSYRVQRLMNIGTHSLGRPMQTWMLLWRGCFASSSAGPTLWKVPREDRELLQGCEGGQQPRNQHMLAVPHERALPGVT